MRWLAAFLLLSACGSKSDEGAAGGDAQAPVDASLEGVGVMSPAQLQARAAERLAGIAKEPRFANLKAGPLGAVCGQVDAKQPNGKYSGMRPFLVTPEGVAVISGTPRIMFEDPADPFPDLYIRWCATPEEMQTIGPILAKTAEAPPPPPPDVPPETIDPVPAGNWGVVPGAAPAPPPPAASPQAPAAPKEKATTPPPPPPPPRQAGDEDSFLKSVIRPTAEPKSGK